MSRPAPAVIADFHLSVVRGPDPEGRWYWRARDPERRTVWTGWASRPDALRTLRELARAPEPPPELLTVGDMLRAWTTAREQDPELRPRTKESYLTVSRHPQRLLGPLPLADLNQAALEGYRNTRIGEGASPRTLQSELVVLRLAWRWAIGRELLHAPPLPPVKLKIRGYVTNHRTPTEPEVAEVLAYLRGEAQLAAQVLAVTGARLSEVLTLRRNDVDLHKAQIHLNGKTGHRVFPLTPGLRRLLEPRADGSTQRLLPVDPGALRTALGEACAAAGVPTFTPHGMRRMAVNRLCRAGIDPKLAAAVTGHSVPVMLAVYRTVSLEDKIKGVRQAGLGQALTGSKVSGQPVTGAQNWAREL